MLACPKIALPDLEAISSILDANLTKLVEVEQMQPVSHLAVPLLQLMLSHPATEPLVISELLSCTSALFACVLVQPSALQPILQKMFAPLAVPNTDNSKCVQVFFKSISANSSNDTFSNREVRTLRRHCCALLVKLGSRFPSTLLPTFDFLRY